MRSSTWGIVLGSCAFVVAACGQIGSPIDASVGGADAHADVVFTFPETGADHYVVPPPPSHDAGPPDGAVVSFPCIDAGADASPNQICPQPKSYCDDQYVVDYTLPFVACSDAGACVFVPVTGDCLGSNCSGCVENDAGASCLCVVPE